MRRKLIIASLASSLFLVSCGVRGDLKTPDPIWGKKKTEQPSTDKPSDAPTPEEPTSDNPT